MSYDWRGTEDVLEGTSSKPIYNVSEVQEFSENLEDEFSEISHVEFKAERGVSERVSEHAGFISDKQLSRFEERQRIISSTEDERREKELGEAMSRIGASKLMQECIKELAFKDPLRNYRNPLCVAVAGKHICRNRNIGVDNLFELMKVTNTRYNLRLNPEDLLRYATLLIKVKNLRIR
jgi:hypothetical protein